MASFVADVMITGVVLFAAFIQTVNGVRCYHCNSYVDTGCGDPFGTNFASVEDCDAKHNTVANRLFSSACIKKTEKTSDGLKITRQCLLPQEITDLIPPESRDLPCMDLPDGSFLCQCYHDLCNGASSTTANLLLCSTVTAVAMLLKFL